MAILVIGRDNVWCDECDRKDPLRESKCRFCGALFTHARASGVPDHEYKTFVVMAQKMNLVISPPITADDQQVCPICQGDHIPEECPNA